MPGCLDGLDRIADLDDHDFLLPARPGGQLFFLHPRSVIIRFSGTISDRERERYADRKIRRVRSKQIRQRPVETAKQERRLRRNKDRWIYKRRKAKRRARRVQRVEQKDVLRVCQQHRVDSRIGGAAGKTVERKRGVQIDLRFFLVAEEPQICLIGFLLDLERTQLKPIIHCVPQCSFEVHRIKAECRGIGRNERLRPFDRERVAQDETF